MWFISGNVGKSDCGGIFHNEAAEARGALIVQGFVGQV